MRVRSGDKEVGRLAPMLSPAEVLIERLRLVQDILVQVLGTPAPPRQRLPREVGQAHALVKRALGGLQRDEM